MEIKTNKILIRDPDTKNMNPFQPFKVNQHMKQLRDMAIKVQKKNGIMLLRLKNSSNYFN